jgi:hypothetical protein
MTKWSYEKYTSSTTKVLNVVDVHLTFVSKLESTLAILFTECVCFVDFGVFWKFAINLHYDSNASFTSCQCDIWHRKLTRTIPRFVSGILDDDICFSVLEFSKRKQNNIALIFPNLDLPNAYQGAYFEQG